MKYSYHDQVSNIKYEGCTILPSLEEIELQLKEQWDVTIPIGGIVVYGDYVYQKFNKTTWSVPRSYEPEARKPCNTQVYPATCWILKVASTKVTTPEIQTQTEIVTPEIQTQTEIVTPEIQTQTEIVTPAPTPTPVIQKKLVIQKKSVSIAEAAAVMKSQSVMQEPPPPKEKFNFKNIAPMLDLSNVFNKDKQQEEQNEEQNEEKEGECKSRVLSQSLLLGTPT